jgi:hypothetical protein
MEQDKTTYRASPEGGAAMAVRQPRYSKEEFARRGTEIYERDIRPQVEASSKGKIVAIDIESGAYSIGDNILSATMPLYRQNPDAQIWIVRVGYRAVHRIGLRSLPVAR